MSTHKSIDRICCIVIVLALLLTGLMVYGKSAGLQAAARTMGYEARLFATDQVHTIDIEMDDWESFLTTCENEEYAACTVVIDNEARKNVAIRAKGNTSLRNVSSLGSQRYSFKLEFDHYEAGKSYHGLDKLSLNNLIQDNTMLKDYLTYQMMRQFGVDAPLCSYVYLTVNGEPWGLYLAVEGVEDAFLERNYDGAGNLYKPDSMDMGGGRGNGRDFDMENFDPQNAGAEPTNANREATQRQPGEMRNPMSGRGMGGRPDDMKQKPTGMGGEMPERPEGMPEMPEGMPEMPSFMGGPMGGNGSADVKLQYIDDDPSSYSNIFENAKTSITEADKNRLIASLKTLSEGEDIASVVDTQEVLRYFVVHNFVCNGDSYTGGMIHNYYLHEKDGVMSMIPWDYNLAFGGFQSSSATSTVNSPIDSPVSGGSVDDRPMVAWIFDGGEYESQYHTLYAEFLAHTDFAEMIDATVERIAPYVAEDPTKFCTYEAFQTGVETLRSFCLLRAQSVTGQLDGSIPATSEGQSADSSALIDASAITISDMGTMGAGMGGGRGQMPENFGELPEGFDPSSGEPPEGFTPDGERGGFPSPDGEMRGDFPSPDGEMPGGFSPPGGEMGNFPQGQPMGRTSTQPWYIAGACVLVLLLGLLATRLFRRK